MPSKSEDIDSWLVHNSGTKKMTLGLNIPKKTNNQLYMSLAIFTTYVSNMVLILYAAGILINPFNGYNINPYYWVDGFISCYMEIKGVDQPDRTHVGNPWLFGMPITATHW